MSFPLVAVPIDFKVVACLSQYGEGEEAVSEGIQNDSARILVCMCL